VKAKGFLSLFYMAKSAGNHKRDGNGGRHYNKTFTIVPGKFAKKSVANPFS
jgi:hypothetical protein